jgi:plasmid maintenance system antidote protein VapI
VHITRFLPSFSASHRALSACAFSFGSEAQGWLDLQSAYDLRVAEITARKAITKAIKPLALA